MARNQRWLGARYTIVPVLCTIVRRPTATKWHSHVRHVPREVSGSSYARRNLWTFEPLTQTEWIVCTGCDTRAPYYYYGMACMVTPTHSFALNGQMSSACSVRCSRWIKLIWPLVMALGQGRQGYDDVVCMYVRHYIQHRWNYIWRCMSAKVVTDEVRKEERRHKIGA